MPPREGRRFVVTTVIRGAPVEEVSGRVYVVDVDDGRVLAAVAMPETPWRHTGTNPRGGHRGGRGIAVAGDTLALANADEIRVLDRTWRTTATLSHSLIGDIHELEPAANGLWACSTRADSLVRIGWDGAVVETWSWRDDPGLLARFGYRSVAPIDESVDFRDMRRVDVAAVDLSHVNGVQAVEDGLLVSLGRVRFPSPSPSERVLAGVGRVAHVAVVGRPLVSRMRAERLRRFGADPQPGVERRGLIVHVRQRRPAAVVVDRPLTAWPNHNVLEHGREIVLCETSRGRLLAVDRETRAERSVEVQPASGFLRGLAWLDGDRFVVGSRRPAALHVVDLDTRAVGPTLTLSKEWHESVHDIAPLPDDWDDPPAGLAV